MSEPQEQFGRDSESGEHQGDFDGIEKDRVVPGRGEILPADILAGFDGSPERPVVKAELEAFYNRIKAGEGENNDGRGNEKVGSDAAEEPLSRHLIPARRGGLPLPPRRENGSFPV